MPAPSTSPDEDALTKAFPLIPPKGAVLDFLGTSPEGLAAIFDEAPPAAPIGPGSVIGRYLLIEPIGEGGFGMVWHAEQQEPFTRDVALKLIRPDKASPDIISRFERERQALAMMDHENIAKVFDAGEHEGQLFFVMEYVPGRPITSYVKECALSLKQRVGLFIPVCRAVHHAHVKQVLHRDLKPANILVSIKDDKATPKVIDFGIAKALAGDHAMLRADTGTLPVTQLGYVLGTPQYMSPEQARGRADIDAASDIYTLGVILYELLVGEPPITADELARQHDHFGALQFIIEHKPVLPSTLWLQASTGRTRALDSTMGQEPRRISRQMREDLDWIILHALQKDRSHRYASADALADDLQRYLDHEPVSVGPPSLGYRWRKFYLRHKAGSIAAMLVLGSIIGGGGVATWQWREALVAKNLEAAARQRAEIARTAETVARQQAETSQRLAETREKEAEHARDQEAKARAAADTAREQETRARRASDLARTEAEGLINFMLFDMRDRLEPLNRTPLLATIADKAEAYFTAQAATLGDNPAQARNRAAMHQNKGLIELAQGRADAALRSFSTALQLVQSLANETPPSYEKQIDLALAHNRLGMAHQAKGDLAAAQREYQREQDLVIAVLKDKPDSTSWRLHLATTHEHLGDVSEPPLPHYQRAFELLLKLQAEQPASIEVIRALATAHEKLGVMLRGLNQPADALPHFDQQLGLLDRLPDSLDNDVRIRKARAIGLQNKGAALLAARRAEEALPVLTAALVSSQAIAGADPANQLHQQDLANVEGVLAACHWELGQAALKIGTKDSIKTALQHFNQGRDALKTTHVTDSKSASSHQEQRQRFEQALTEIRRLLPGS